LVVFLKRFGVSDPDIRRPSVARTVLVADDSPTHQRRASGILTGEGLEVVTVSNGVAAIKKLSTLRPALILADVSMPGRDGYEVCEFVKSSPDLARVPVLLIFSDLEPFDEGRAQRVRADGRVKKPFGQDELVATVNRFLLEVEEAPPPPPVRAAYAAPAEPAIVTEPVDEEPQVAPKEEFPDLSLSEGMAFGEPAIQEEAAPGFERPPVMEQPPIPEPPMDSGFGFAPPTEEMPSPEVAAPPEVETPPEAGEAPTPEMPAAPEAEAPSEEAAPTEPVLEEEEAATAIPPSEPAPAERTMMFRTPVQIAEPILSDELAPPPVAEPEPEAAPEAEIPAAESPWRAPRLWKAIHSMRQARDRCASRRLKRKLKERRLKLRRLRPPKPLRPKPKRLLQLLRLLRERPHPPRRPKKPSSRPRPPSRLSTRILSIGSSTASSCAWPRQPCPRRWLRK
jgi:CheY-like chemotaxis protein